MKLFFFTPDFKKYHAIQWSGIGNIIGQSYDYIQKLERIHAPRLVINVHWVLLYIKSGAFFEYFKFCDKRIDFKSERSEHIMGRTIYFNHRDMKDLSERRDWIALYRMFVNLVCPPLSHYLKLKEIL